MEVCRHGRPLCVYCAAEHDQDVDELAQFLAQVKEELVQLEGHTKIEMGCLSCGTKFSVEEVDEVDWTCPVCVLKKRLAEAEGLLNELRRFGSDFMQARHWSFEMVGRLIDRVDAFLSTPISPNHVLVRREDLDKALKAFYEGEYPEGAGCLIEYQRLKVALDKP